MREKLVRAVQEHLRRHGQCSGFFLVTFENGEAIVSAETRGDDGLATEVIGLLAKCMDEDVTEVDTDMDAIGPCWGSA